MTPLCRPALPAVVRGQLRRCSGGGGGGGGGGSLRADSRSTAGLGPPRAWTWAEQARGPGTDPLLSNAWRSTPDTLGFTRGVPGARTDGAGVAWLKQQRVRTGQALLRAEKHLQHGDYVLGEKTLTALMATAARLGAHGEAERYYQRLRECTRGFSAQSLNAILYTRACARDVAGAKRAWDELGEGRRTGESYSSIMCLHSNLKRPDNAVRTYQQMLTDGVEPTQRLTTHLVVCATKAAAAASEKREVEETVALVERECGRHDAPWDAHLCTAVMEFLSRAVPECTSDRLLTVLFHAKHPNDVKLWTPFIMHFARRPDARAFLRAVKTVEKSLRDADMDVVFHGAVACAARAVILASTRDRDSRAVLAVAEAALRKARVRFGVSRVLAENMLLVYEAAGEVERARALCALLLKLDSPISRVMKETLARLEAVHAAAQEAKEKGLGSNGLSPADLAPSCGLDTAKAKASRMGAKKNNAVQYVVF